MGDIHTHVAMLSVNLVLIVSTPNPAPLSPVVAIKIISLNLSIFYEKCYIITILRYDFFLHYVTKEVLIECAPLTKEEDSK